MPILPTNQKQIEDQVLTALREQIGNISAKEAQEIQDNTRGISFTLKISTRKKKQKKRVSAPFCLSDELYQEVCCKLKMAQDKSSAEIIVKELLPQKKHLIAFLKKENRAYESKWTKKLLTTNLIQQLVLDRLNNEARGRK